MRHWNSLVPPPRHPPCAVFHRAPCNWNLFIFFNFVWYHEILCNFVQHCWILCNTLSTITITIIKTLPRSATSEPLNRCFLMPSSRSKRLRNFLSFWYGDMITKCKSGMKNRNINNEMKKPKTSDMLDITEATEW